MDPTLAGLIGAGIGALAGLLGSAISVLGSIAIQSYQRENERKDLASAFYGEIGALLEIVSRRRYIEHLDNTVNLVRQTNTKAFYSIKPTKEYFNVFNRNIDKIGTLPAPLPEKIVSAYTLAFSILEDVELNASKEQFDNRDLAALIEHLESLLSLFRLAVHYGEEAKAIIRRKGMLTN
jgi:hypothetical protein